jgi:hypothetical protein
LTYGRLEQTIEEIAALEKDTLSNIHNVDSSTNLARVIIQSGRKIYEDIRNAYKLFGRNFQIRENLRETSA